MGLAIVVVLVELGVITWIGPVHGHTYSSAAVEWIGAGVVFVTGISDREFVRIAVDQHGGHAWRGSFAPFGAGTLFRRRLRTAYAKGLRLWPFMLARQPNVNRLGQPFGRRRGGPSLHNQKSTSL